MNGSAGFMTGFAVPRKGVLRSEGTAGKGRSRIAARALCLALPASLPALATVHSVVSDVPVHAVSASAAIEEPSCGEEFAQRVRDIIHRQNEIPVPHELEAYVTVENERYAGARVMRIDPDSLHIQHAAGIERLEYERMPADWRDVYHIDPEAAGYFRILRARQNRHTAEASAARAAAAAERDMAARREHSARIEQAEQDRMAAEQDRQRQMLVRAWQRYDRDIQEYNDAVRLAESGSELVYNPVTERFIIRQRAVRIPRRPLPPSQPRPPGHYPDAPCTRHAVR